ncbi:UDP-glucose--hexose-1-phosphate uridylyltransferase [Gorillibacterium timonense]|uniref:UDP-glucose--hexose-1-phosphate uridylyltransferase n=1 Tax=Gorillibacterium timonense TaxID=1689269 RepID=UPI00071E40F1|nr:UDP-glucose--hexose-1-phosphate uridylyltransferase [Gorillibacterium timonense]
MDIKLEIARLLQFGVQRGFLGEGDEIVAQNALLDLLQVDEPYAGEIPDERLTAPVSILEHILDYAAEQGILPENNTTQRDLLDARIMGLLLPRQSEVAKTFRQLAAQAPEKATDWFYQLSTDSNYIRMDRIRKNEMWLAPTEYGDLEITVNLSKPEKDPKEIAAERNAPQSRYPKCLLCLENIGYAGRLNHPARQNHRVIPLGLNGEPWFLQYSPYIYYNEHCIVFSREHVPMKVSRNSFVRLLSFVGQMPHYFIGSNADLPIVGGSILSHDHFQGGRHVFPMEKAPVESSFQHNDYPGVSIGIVKWPMSVIRISGDNPDHLIELADTLLTLWRAYSDPQADVLAFSRSDEGEVLHNTITPIARRNLKGEYELDLVLRNNRTTEEHPLGLFHPHADLHHIKKENIGLIEVMGLAVLPGRLKDEIEAIAEWLVEASQLSAAPAIAEGSPLAKHAEWMEQLRKEYKSLTKEQALEAVRREVGSKFARVLLDAGVYKRDNSGRAGFSRFMEHAGFAPVAD